MVNRGSSLRNREIQERNKYFFLFRVNKYLSIEVNKLKFTLGVPDSLDTVESDLWKPAFGVEGSSPHKESFLFGVLPKLVKSRAKQ